MNLQEITLIIVILNTLLTVWSIRVLSLSIHNGLSTILGSIHEAIDKLVQGGGILGDFEPPNPIQQAIAEMLTNRVRNMPIEMERDPAGKFSGEKIS